MSGTCDRDPWGTVVADEFFSGYRIDLEDHEWLASHARLWSAVPGLEFAPPKSMDPRPWYKVENQGNQGSCQGCSLAANGELGFYHASGSIIQFSKQWAYIKSQELDGIRGDQGSTCTAGIKVATQQGLCPESVWPYPNPVRYDRNEPANAASEAANYKLDQHVRFEADSYQRAFDWIVSGGTLHMGFVWTSQMANLGPVCERLSLGTQGMGGHSTAILGYSERKDRTGRNYLLWANSHGKGWGKDGWCELAPDAYHDLFGHRWTEVLGLRAMPLSDDRSPPVL